MKPIRTLLECWTRWGSKCYHRVYPTKTEALKEGRWYVKNDYAFSYKITPNYTGNE